MSFRRYLEAKKSVEEDCLSLRVLEDVCRHVDRPDGDDATVFEAGAGVGSMVQHLVERDVLPDSFSYTAVDVDGRNVERGLEHLAEWGRGQDYTVEREDDSLRFDGKKSFDVTFVEADLYDHREGEYDLVVAHALLDVLELGVRLSTCSRSATPSTSLSVSTV